MAKFKEASDEVVKLFDEIRYNTSIPNWVEFKVLCNDKQKKEPVKIVKSNELVEILSEGVNFAVVVNEEIFNELPDDLQKMAFDECLASVRINENDVLSAEKPDFNTHVGVLKKYGYDKIIMLHESVKSLYDAKKQKEDEEKAMTKGKRGRKPKQK